MTTQSARYLMKAFNPVRLNTRHAVNAHHKLLVNITVVLSNDHFTDNAIEDETLRTHSAILPMLTPSKSKASNILLRKSNAFSVNSTDCIETE